jgi:membrane protease YdiL (CAAX protease family)
MPTLIALTLLPLVIIGIQIALGAEGAAANSIYKLSFILPPLVYCRAKGISLRYDIFKWQNWRSGLRLSLLLGVAAAAIFLGTYALFGDLLLDKAAITAKIKTQFSVTAATVLLIAPVTIILNSMIEEFFYRGFTYRLLAAKNIWWGTLLPATVFTIQHLLFIYHWVTILPLVLAIVGLMVFALALQAVYSAADTIVAPWVIHVLGDVAMMLIAVELVFKAVQPGTGP